MILSLLLLLLPGMASGTEFKFHKHVEPGLLQNELISAGFKVNSINCDGTSTDCVISMPASEKKDPSKVVEAHSWRDPQTDRRKIIGELKALQARFKAGTDTQSDDRRAIELLLSLMGI